MNMFKKEEFKLKPSPKKRQLGWLWHREVRVTTKPIWISSLTARTRGGRQGKDMITDSKYISQVNTREGAEVFKLKDDVGTRTNDYK